MLTPVEIQKKTFKQAGIGYDRKDVDVFMQNMADSYEAIYSENMELNEKLTELNEQLNYYRSIEKTMQKALILAEKTADETKTTAAETARQIEGDAIAKAQMILGNANRDLDIIKQQIIAMYQEYENFKIKVKNLTIAQNELMDSDVFNLSEVTSKWINTSLEPERTYTIPEGFRSRKKKNGKEPAEGFEIVEDQE